MMFVPGRQVTQSFAGRSFPRLSMTTDLPVSLHIESRYPDGRTTTAATPISRLAANFRRWGRLGILSIARRLDSALVCAILGSAVNGCHPATARAPAIPASDPSSAGQATSVPAESLYARMDRSRILGDSTAKIWFVMASDFQCPYCKQFHDQSFAALRQQYVATGKVRMAYINFPLAIHANAWPAAEAAMCAGAQGKFWQMQDALFASQDRWAEKQPAAPVLDSVAQSLGVDTTALDRCVGSKSVHDLIDADRDRAERAGVSATPTIIIGDQLLQGVEPIQNYQHVIDSALASKR
jgi:protein-disulfide isomerase